MKMWQQSLQNTTSTEKDQTTRELNQLAGSLYLINYYKIYSFKTIHIKL